MCLMQHSIRTATEIKRAVIDTHSRNQEILIAKMVQKSIESWVKRMSTNRIEYPRIRGGLLGCDADSVAVLIQTGHDVFHCVDESLKEDKMFCWCRTELENENAEVKVTSHYDSFLPYWGAFSTPPEVRKRFHLANYESLLLGTAVFHSSACHSPDTICSPGSLIGAFVWCSPNCQIGIMTTIAPHVSLGNDAIVGDYCSIEQNASIGAGARIGECCTIGQGAIVWQGVRIAPGTKIQPGQIIKADVAVRPFAVR